MNGFFSCDPSERILNFSGWDSYLGQPEHITLQTLKRTIGFLLSPEILRKNIWDRLSEKCRSGGVVLVEKHTTTKNSIQEFWWAEKMYKAGTWMEEKVRTS